VSKTLATCLALAAFAGCAVPSDDATKRIAVTESNALGVVALEIERSVENQDNVFELRGLTADEHTVAGVRVRTGEIADLPGDYKTGTEIVLFSDANKTRMITRSQDVVDLGTVPEGDPAVAGLLSLDVARSTLAHEANVRIESTAENTETAYLTAYQVCPANQMLVTPLAQDCCYQTDGGKGQFTLHFNGTQLVKRYKNPYGTGCKASNGTGSCTGTGCYYGPLGYSAPVFYAGTTVWWWDTFSGSAGCSETPAGQFRGPMSVDVTGSQPRGLGCPGGGSAGFWDYP
jgi:hypothetical protein